MKVVFSEENVVPVYTTLNYTAMQRMHPITVTICSCKMNLDSDPGKTWLTDSPSTRFYVNQQNVQEGIYDLNLGLTIHLFAGHKTFVMYKGDDHDDVE